MKRMRLIPDETNIDFFKHAKLTFGASCVAVVLALAVWFTMGLNYGIDFRGGTTLRTQSETAVDVAAYRAAMEPLGLGDVSISEVFDPTSDSSKHVAMVRIQAQDGEEAATPEMIEAVEAALKTVAPKIVFTSVESVGPKVSGELIQTALLAVGASLGAILIYIWLRFEWQFSVGAVAALFHDVILTVGIFSALQIRFDLPVIAAILTIIGYSINDTVVIFDRLRENLRKYKKTPPARCDEHQRQRNPKPDLDDIGHHPAGADCVAGSGWRCDPRFRLCDHMGCRRGYLFVGLCGEKRGAVPGRET